MRAKTSFTFDCESNIWTSNRAISTGATSPAKSVIAPRLSGAARDEMTAAAQKSPKPISIPLKRYENFLPQRLNTSQRMKENINAADTNILNEDINTVLHIGKPYMLSVKTDERVAACTVGLSVNVVRSAIIQRQKARIMYSRHTKALLLDKFELVGGFIIMCGGFKNSDNR
jgi:hypothetical protein